MWLFWVIGGLLLLWAEFHTQALFAVFLAAGAFVAGIAAALGLAWPIDLVVFLVASVLGVVAVRAPLRGWALRHEPPALRLRGMHDGLVGQTAISVDRIGDEHHPGHVLIGGERWLAFTDDPDVAVGPDQNVMVAAVRGTKLLVYPS